MAEFHVAQEIEVGTEAEEQPAQNQNQGNYFKEFLKLSVVCIMHNKSTWIPKKI